MMNFQDKLQTNAPSIRYEGDIRPEQAQLRQQQAQAMQQMQQQAMMQQPQGRMPAGRMPPMAMGGSITGPTIQGQNGIAGLNMPGYAEGGDVENDPNYKGWKKLYEKNKDVAAMHENHKKYLDHYNRTPKAYGGMMGRPNMADIAGSSDTGNSIDSLLRSPDYMEVLIEQMLQQGLSQEEMIQEIMGMQSRTPKAYGGIMGQDGRRQYGIGSWFQETIMDPIKKYAAPVAIGAAGIMGLNKLGGGNFFQMPEFGQIYDGVKKVGSTIFKPYEYEDQKGNTKTTGSLFGLSPALLSTIGGAAAGLFADKIDTPENIDPDYGTGIGIQNIGKAANILDQKQGMQAGLRFLPELSTRKYTPAEMLESFGSPNEPLATANLAEGGAAFQRSSTDVSTSIQMLVKRLQEINAAMVGAEMEEVLPMMREALQIRDKIQELGSSTPQDLEMEAEGIKDMVQQASYSAPEADQTKIYSAGEMLSNTNLGLGKDATINEEIINSIVNQGTGAGIPMAANVESTSQKFDPRLMRAAMGRRPSREIDIPSIRMEGDAGSDMGEFSMENFAEGGLSGGIMETEQSEMLDLGGMEKDYREEGGFVPIGEYEKKDDVPARLSVNEFVFTADAVRGAGDGDIDRGADRLQGIMKELEKQGKPEGMEMMEVSERLSEVV